MSLTVTAQFNPALNNSEDTLLKYNPHVHYIKAAPLPILFGKATLIYQQNINKFFSAGLEADIDYTLWNNLLGNPSAGGSHIHNGIKVSPFIRAYLTDEKYFLPNIYLQGNLSWGYYNMGIEYVGQDQDGYDISIYKNKSFQTMGQSYWIGKQTLLSSNFTLDVGLGIQIFKLPESIEKTSNTIINENGIRYSGDFEQFGTKAVWYYIGPGCPAVLRFDIGYAF